VPPERVGAALYRLRIRRLHLRATTTFPGYPRSDPVEVGRVTAAIEDGSLARAVAGEPLHEFVLRALRRRPALPYGSSDLPIV
jgi:hypothetical protein